VIRCIRLSLVSSLLTLTIGRAEAVADEDCAGPGYLNWIATSVVTAVVVEDDDLGLAATSLLLVVAMPTHLWSLLKRPIACDAKLNADKIIGLEVMRHSVAIWKLLDGQVGLSRK
jgi:hypothetical protein